MLDLQRERQLAEAERATINLRRLNSELGRLQSVSDINVTTRAMTGALTMR